MPLLYKLGTWTLLLLLVAFFALMVPYGTTVTVASDACPLMEERLLLLASEGGGLEDTQRAGLRRLLTYWMFNQGATAATGGVSQLMGYNLVQVRARLGCSASVGVSVHVGAAHRVRRLYPSFAGRCHEGAVSQQMQTFIAIPALTFEELSSSWVHKEQQLDHKGGVLFSQSIVAVDDTLNLSSRVQGCALRYR